MKRWLTFLLWCVELVLSASPVFANPPSERTIAGLYIGMPLQEATAHLGPASRRLEAEEYEMLWLKDGEEIVATVQGGELTSVRGPTLQVRPGVTLSVGESASRIEFLLGKADRCDYFDRHYVRAETELVVASSPRSGKVDGIRIFERPACVRRLTLSLQEPFDDHDVKVAAEIARARLLHLGSKVQLYADTSEGQLHLKAPSEDELASALPVLLARGDRALASSYFDPRLGSESEFDILDLMGRNLLSSQWPRSEITPVFWRGAFSTRDQFVWEFDIRDEVIPTSSAPWEGTHSLRVDGVEVGHGTLREKVPPDSRYSSDPIPEGYHRARYTLRLPKEKARQLSAVLSSPPYPRPIK